MLGLAHVVAQLPRLANRRNSFSASQPARTGGAVSSGVGVNVPASRCASAWLRPVEHLVQAVDVRRPGIGVGGQRGLERRGIPRQAVLGEARRRCSLLG